MKLPDEFMTSVHSSMRNWPCRKTNGLYLLDCNHHQNLYLLINAANWKDATFQFLLILERITLTITVVEATLFKTLIKSTQLLWVRELDFVRQLFPLLRLQALCLPQLKSAASASIHSIMASSWWRPCVLMSSIEDASISGWLLIRNALSAEENSTTRTAWAISSSFSYVLFTWSKTLWPILLIQRLL